MDEKRDLFPHADNENPCIAHRCHRCCLETEMPLTAGDVGRICRHTGMDAEGFTVFTGGWVQLRNVNGRCVFLDENGHCKIYEDRPEGCRYYPFIYYEQDRRVLEDEDCPYPDEFKRNNEIVRKVKGLVERLKEEREG